LDLRTIFKEPETQDYYVAGVPITLTDIISAQVMASQKVSEDYFPSAGFFFGRPSFDLDDLEAVSRQRNRGILLLRLSDHTASPNSISSRKLTEGLSRFQKLVKSAYRRALRMAQPKIRELIETPDFWETETFAFSEGSFTVHLQTKRKADLAGNIELDRAFQILDDITSKISDTELSIEELKKYSGRVVSAYKDILEFIIDADTNLSYGWQTPSRSVPIERELPKRHAEPLYERFKEYRELTREIVKLTGTIRKGDAAENGSWTLIDENGKEHRGITDLSIGVSLEGVVLSLKPLGAKRYEFTCDEQISEHPITGREKRILVLISFREIGNDPLISD
jgi:hypothetical protein